LPENPVLRVRLVGWTQFRVPDDIDWSTDADGGQALAEFAGRACYESWHKPNPATATNTAYLRHLLEVGHLTALEHGTATFYLTGLSHSCAHELTRHRHLSCSQLSPRHAAPGDDRMIVPDLIADDPELRKKYFAATAASVRAYEELLAMMEATLADAPGATLRRKQMRQAARAVLPHAAETRLVVTGNYRTWRHLIAVRATGHTDAELRAVAVACLRELQRCAPNAFGDFAISTLADGSEIAASPLAWES
jgi:thymidylate synthase (FAD)